MLVVYKFNLSGRRAYEKAGFRECGRRRQAHLMGGRWWDVIYMQCLASEFAILNWAACTYPLIGSQVQPHVGIYRVTCTGSSAAYRVTCTGSSAAALVDLL
jgi:hypothetical protein